MMGLGAGGVLSGPVKSCPQGGILRRYKGPNARDHAFRTAVPELVDHYTDSLRLPQEDASDELWIEDPNFLRCLISI